LLRRTLEVEGDPDTKVSVKLGAPKLNEKTSDYECPFQITGAGFEIDKYASGLDGIQALQLALTMIGAYWITCRKLLGYG
jgi:hypothetical protein